MNYKRIGLAACAVILALSVIAPLAVNGADSVGRVHQHRGALPESLCTVADDGGLCTYLPIVEIDTGGQTIPGRPIYHEDRTVTYTLSESGETTITAGMKVIGEDTAAWHHANGEADAESAIQIRIRGNSSRSFDKPSYAIRLVDDTGANAPQSLMGMDSHHEWVLYGPWLDKTAVRNYMFYNLAGEIMDYAPNVRYCEVIVDGVYQGLYLLTENVTGGQDGTRLGLTVSAKDKDFTGYLLRLDHQVSDAEPLRSFTTYTYTTPLLLQIEYPGARNRDEALTEAIRQDFSDFEKALYSFDYDREIYGYEEWLDSDSFVDYFILNELSSNADAGNYSTYIYKGTDGLFRMCVWDFNNACDNFFDEKVSYEGFFLQNRLWYWMLMKDEDFTERILHRYRQLREDILSQESLDAYVDEVMDFLAPALRRNDAAWGDVSQQAAKLLVPYDRNLTSREAAVGQLKGYLHNRGNWLDKHIDTLRQYSAGSKVKQYNEVND